MKKSLFLIVAAAACVAFASCNKNDVVYDQLFLDYFGFTAEDNPEVLSNDIIVEKPAVGKIEISLPVGTDEEALKSLIPHMSVTILDGQTIGLPKILVDGFEYYDGAIDFSDNVDLEVVNGNVSSLYNISVKISAAPTWVLEATSEVDFYNTPFMAINPKDGCPYITGTANSDDSAKRYPLGFKVSDGKFTGLTSNGELAQNRADNAVIGFDPDGKAYVHYLDYINGSTAALLRSSVVTVNNGTAALVGKAADIYAQGSNSAIFPIASNNIWLGFQMKNATGALAKRVLALANWNGTTWANENAIPGRTASDYGYLTVGASRGNHNYLLVFNQNVNNVSLYSYEEGAWKTIFERLVINKADGSVPETPSINTRGIDLAIDSKGNPYMMILSQYKSEVYNPAIVKYDLQSKKQSIIGGVPDLNGNDLRYFSIAFDSFDTPYMAYQTAEKKLAVMYVNNKTKLWSDPTILEGCNLNGIYAPTIRFNEDGKGFIAALDYVSSETKKCKVFATK